MSSKVLLSDYLIEKLLPFRLTGVENIKNFTPFLRKLASLIMFHVPMHISRMGLLKESTDIMSRLVSLSLLMLLCL